MADPTATAPAVHAVILDPALLPLQRCVGFGAEEVGVPTRVTRVEAHEPVAAAYEAARASAFGVGLALGQGRIVLHESHMPPRTPVLAEALSSDAETVARRFGANAARMVVRQPLRFGDDVAPIAPPAPRRAAPARTDNPQSDPPPEPSADEVRRVVALVVAQLGRRGAQ